MARAMETMQEAMNNGKEENFHTGFRLTHVLWENERGDVESYPEMVGGTDGIEGYKGVARNSFIRICNLADEGLKKFKLLDAKTLLEQEFDDPLCDMTDLLSTHEYTSFLYASYAATCQSGAKQTFSLCRIHGNFVFVGEKRLGYNFDELPEDKKVMEREDLGRPISQSTRLQWSEIALSLIHI